MAALMVARSRLFVRGAGSFRLVGWRRLAHDDAACLTLAALSVNFRTLSEPFKRGGFLPNSIVEPMVETNDIVSDWHGGVDPFVSTMGDHLYGRPSSAPSSGCAAARSRAKLPGPSLEHSFELLEGALGEIATGIAPHVAGDAVDLGKLAERRERDRRLNRTRARLRSRKMAAKGPSAAQLQPNRRPSAGGRRESRVF